MTLKTALAKESTNTKVFDSWNPNNSVCIFTGITCDDSASFVTEIDLSRQNLRGSMIPFDSICELRSLHKLSLGFNALHGTVSKDINKCSNLTYLDLGNNMFSGPMPSISSMSSLRYLYVNGSGFQGAFPWESLESMKELIVLSVGDNPFDQTFEFPKQVVKLLKLQWLYMSNCSIAGEIPSAIGDLTSLVNFEAAMNFITGEIPVEITKLVYSGSMNRILWY
nr:receptor-like protein kinase HAIKU2 [Tanacetum cinerariifolium]